MKYSMKDVREFVAEGRVYMSEDGSMMLDSTWERGDFTSRVRHLLRKGEAVRSVGGKIRMVNG